MLKSIASGVGVKIVFAILVIGVICLLGWYLYKNFKLELPKELTDTIGKATSAWKEYTPVGLLATVILGESKARGSVLAQCPPGYTNNGPGGCGRGTDDYSAPSRLAKCPPGYTNNGPAGCGRGTDDYSAPSRLADCQPGFENMGTYCGKGILPWNIETHSLGHGTCPAGYFKGIMGRCYKYCKTGYNNTGETCHRTISTMGPDVFTCPPGYFKGITGDRCHKDCITDYTNMGETCHRPVSTKGPGAMGCPPPDNPEYTTRIADRCYKPCDAGWEESSGGIMCSEI